MQILLVMTVIGTFLTTAFAANSVYRDFESQADAIFFSLPLRKADYLFGRLFGSLRCRGWCTSPSCSRRDRRLMPWLEPERIGPFRLAPYVFSMLAFVLPNVIITGAIFFAIATLTRSLLYTYAACGVLRRYAIAGIFLDNLDNRNLAALVDPHGFGAFELVTRYWTVAEKNAGPMPLRGILLSTGSCGWRWPRRSCSLPGRVSDSRPPGAARPAGVVRDRPPPRRDSRGRAATPVPP